MLEEKKIDELIEEGSEIPSLGMISFEPLHKILKKHGITIKMLQEKYGIDPSHINRNEYNHDYVMKMVKKLCEILNCEPEDIINIVDNDKK